MNERNCPSRDQLIGYVQGTIPEEKAESVAEHLEGCLQCEAAVEQFESQGDRLISTARPPSPAGDGIDSPECLAALTHAETILAILSDADGSAAQDDDSGASVPPGRTDLPS